MTTSIQIVINVILYHHNCTQFNTFKKTWTQTSHDKLWLINTTYLWVKFCLYTLHITHLAYTVSIVWYVLLLNCRIFINAYRAGSSLYPCGLGLGNGGWPVQVQYWLVSTECGLLAGGVSVHLLGCVAVHLSKANCSGCLTMWQPHHSKHICTMTACLYVKNNNGVKTFNFP